MIGRRWLGVRMVVAVDIGPPSADELTVTLTATLTAQLTRHIFCSPRARNAPQRCRMGRFDVLFGA